MQPTLTVHLDAIAENYRRLKAQFSGGDVAAVVKADAYGLGASEVSKRLVHEGCQLLFVATLEEAIELKSQLTNNLADKKETRSVDRASHQHAEHRPMENSVEFSGGNIRIAAFHGPFKGEEDAFIEHSIIPVINYISQLERWMVTSKTASDASYMLHIDTGMTRLGLSSSDMKWLAEHGTALLERPPSYLLSHLACAEDKHHEKNGKQLIRFTEARQLFPNVPISFCNSSGMYLSPDFHGEMARPGSALYGINPATWMDENPMQHVADLTAPIIMIRHLDRAETIGYGASATLPEHSRIAIVQMGYADGYLRYLSNQGKVFIDGMACPVVGRVSMDMIAVDVTHLSEQILHHHSHVDIICEQQPVDVVAKQAGTIGYEIFTSLSNRVKREYALK